MPQGLPRTGPGLVIALALLAGAGDLGAQLPSEGAAPSPAALAGRSLLIPGWGQVAQGQKRAAAYAAIDVALWVFWGQRRARGGELRDAYRDLAWETARSGRGARVDGPWAYYETLTKWGRSGAYDRDPGSPGLQPEEDPATYNGSQWRLARDLHFRGGSPAPGEPAYQAALAWYAANAYDEAFLWDWTGREEALAEFRDLIDRSDDRFRQATTALGAILANHLLSSADAFVSAQVPGEARLRVVPPDTPWGPLQLTLGWTPPS